MSTAEWISTFLSILAIVIAFVAFFSSKKNAKQQIELAKSVSAKLSEENTNQLHATDKNTRTKIETDIIQTEKERDDIQAQLKTVEQQIETQKHSPAYVFRIYQEGRPSPDEIIKDLEQKRDYLLQRLKEINQTLQKLYNLKNSLTNNE